MQRHHTNLLAGVLVFGWVELLSGIPLLLLRLLLHISLFPFLFLCCVLDFFSWTWIFLVLVSNSTKKKRFEFYVCTMFCFIISFMFFSFFKSFLVINSIISKTWKEKGEGESSRSHWMMIWSKKGRGRKSNQLLLLVLTF